ncbi:hypothetical protein RZO55_01840 [Clostridium boliviensis]|uniref:DUF998 domain-containing protein n=1 Tax=Clostridium boliviensis TaxID=318465 RepID=A0ABU4GFC6_9CLOT|nr:hypothetical protein [Clostridium boliviensis]MDW2796331.1 hypothetical protein [Clostridium boliviensis]
MTVLTITAYFIIPVYTILFAWGTNWFTLNFSILGSLADRKNLFLLWGIVVGTYFYYVLKRIIRTLPRNKKEKVCTTLALMLLAMAVTIPYLPDTQPFHAVLHVVLSFAASISLLLSLYLVIWKLYCMNQTVYRPYFISLLLITGVSAVLFFLTGIVSTALEIFFVLSSTFLLHRLYGKVCSPRILWKYQRL